MTKRQAIRLSTGEGKGRRVHCDTVFMPLPVTLNRTQRRQLAAKERSAQKKAAALSGRGTTQS